MCCVLKKNQNAPRPSHVILCLDCRRIALIDRCLLKFRDFDWYMPIEFKNFDWYMPIEFRDFDWYMPIEFRDFDWYMPIEFRNFDWYMPIETCPAAHI